MYICFFKPFFPKTKFCKEPFFLTLMRIFYQNVQKLSSFIGPISKIFRSGVFFPYLIGEYLANIYGPDKSFCKFPHISKKKKSKLFLHFRRRKKLSHNFDYEKKKSMDKSDYFFLQDFIFVYPFF